jgi:uncharacterized protein (DUF2237 family)
MAVVPSNLKKKIKKNKNKNKYRDGFCKTSHHDNANVIVNNQLT